MQIKTFLDGITFRRDGSLDLRLVSFIVSDNGAERPLKSHSFTGWPPGLDLGLAFDGLNMVLESIDMPRMGADDESQVRNLAAIVWTPDVVAAYEAKQPRREPDPADVAETDKPSEET